MREPFRDLDHLLLTGRQPGDRHARVEVDLEIGQDPPGALDHRILTNDAQGIHRLAAREDVLSHAERPDEAALLVHHRDPGIRGTLLAEAGDRSTVERDGPSVGLVHARHQMHERGLPRTVLADQGMHLAALDLERDIIDRAHAGKGLDDVPHREPLRPMEHCSRWSPRSDGGADALAQGRVSCAAPPSPTAVGGTSCAVLATMCQ